MAQAQTTTGEPSAPGATGVAEPAPPTPPAVPWWGPETLADGWNLRVPVVVINHKDHALENAPVVADLDLRDLAIDAGWPAGETGDRQFLKSFTLLPSSVRVVEYTNFRMPRTSPSDATLVEADGALAGDERYVVPARSTPGFLLTPEERPFDPDTNPTVSVTWTAAGTLEPGQRRTYMVYVDVAQNGAVPSADQARVQEALAGLHWISRGTDLYGTGAQVTITGLAAQTRVTVHTYEGLRPVQHRPAPGQGTNPFTVNQGESVTIALGTQPTAFRVVASKPVVATGGVAGGDLDIQSRDTGFIPSADGGLRGTRFLADVSPNRFYVYTDDPRGTSGTVNGRQFITDGLVTELDVSERLLDLRTSRPVLVQARPDMDRYQFVDLDTGGPVGDHLIGTAFATFVAQSRAGPFRAHDQGRVLVATLGVEAAAAKGYRSEPARQLVIPVAEAGARPPAMDVPAGGWARVDQREDWGFTPLDLIAVDPDDPGRGAPGTRLVAIGGPAFDQINNQRAPLASPVGGELALNFTTNEAVHVFAFYNATTVQATWDNGTALTGLISQGERLRLPATDNVALHIEASKPVAVVPGQGIAYAPGRLEGPRVEPLGLQFRGYLVSLTPAGGAEEPLVETASFGQTVTYELEVTNLGRNTTGTPLTDRVRLDHPPAPPGWNVTLEPRAVELTSGETATVTVTVRTPETRNLGDRLRMPVSATSENNQRMSAQVETVTLLRERREVGLWYGEIDGPSQLLVRFNPGETRAFDVVVQNKGSAKDATRLALTGLQAGWEAALRTNDTPAVVLPLKAGQAKTLTLDVTAPPSGGIILPTSFTVSAASLNDTTAAAKVLFDGLVLAKSKLRLDTPQDLLRVRPGTTARFQLELGNEGNASADVQLNVSADLPPGWPGPTFRFQGQSLATVGNRLTNLPPTGNAPLQLELGLPVPANATGRLHVKLLVTATPQGGTGDRAVTLPVNVFVEPVVDLTVATPTATRVVPGSSADVVIGLANHGNANATVPVVARDVPQGWSIVHPSNVTLVSGQNTTLTVGLGVPAGAASANRTLTFRTVLPNGTARTMPVEVQVPTWRAFILDDVLGPNATRVLAAGVPTNLTIPVRAIGNAPIRVLADIEDPDGWTVTARALPEVLDPLATGVLRVTVEPPALDGPRDATLRLTPRLPAPPPTPEAAATTTELAMRAVPVDLALQEAGVVPPPRARAAAIVRGILVNHADVSLDNVTVAVTQDGRVISSVVLSRLPAGSPRVFALELDPALAAQGGLEVVVDPADRFPEPDETNNVRALAALDEGNALPLPAWLVLVGLVAGAAVATAARSPRGRAPPGRAGDGEGDRHP